MMDGQAVLDLGSLVERVLVKSILLGPAPACADRLRLVGLTLCAVETDCQAGFLEESGT
jgi:hypothetical protein